MRKLPIVVLALFVSVLAACGDDDEGGGGADLGGEEQEFVDAAMEDFDPESAAPLEEGESRCIVESMVDSLGLERLDELGVEPEDFGDDTQEAFPEGLTEDEANDVVDGFDSCFDLSALFLEGLAEEGTLSDDDRECLADAFDKETMRNLFVTILTQGEDAMQEDPEMVSELLAVFSECPDALQGMMGAEG